MDGGDSEISCFRGKGEGLSFMPLVFTVVGILIIVSGIASAQETSPHSIQPVSNTNISNNTDITLGVLVDILNQTVDNVTWVFFNSTGDEVYSFINTTSVTYFSDTNTVATFEWNLTVNINSSVLPEDVYEIAVATNRSSPGQNWTIQNSTNILLDYTPPEITWITANNTWTSEDYLKIYFNVSDSGSGVNLSTITISVSGGSIDFTPSANCTGTSAEYTCNATWNTTGLADATGYTITVTANDSITLGSDNQNSSTLTLNLDKTPPTGPQLLDPSPANNSVTQSTTFNFNWSVSDNLANSMICNLTINGVVNQSVITANNTPTNVTVSGFSDGIYSWNVTCYDNATNSNTSETRVFTVDTVPPAVDYVAPTPPSNANLSQDWVYVNVTLNDVTSAINTCLLEFNSTNYTMSFVNTTDTRRVGYCSLNMTGLNEALHNFSVYVNDSAGNLNRTLLRYVTLDITPPQVTINVPTKNANVSGILNVNTTVVDNLLAVDTVQFNLSNTTWSRMFTMSRQAGTNYWNYSLDTTTIQDDIYNITIKANDTADNINYTVYVTITVDNNAPIITIVAPTPSSGTITNRTYVYVNASAQDLQLDSGLLEWNGSINYTMNKVGSTFWYNITNLADGAYTYKVYVNDSFGNFNVSETRSITIDTALTGITVGDINTSAVNNYTDNVTATNSVIIINTGNTSVNGSITINEYVGVPVGVNPLTPSYGLGSGEKTVNIYINATPSDNLNATSGNVSWVIIKIYYRDEDITELVESSLRLYWYNESGGRWVKLTAGLNLTSGGGPYVYEVGVNTANNYVWANLSRLSVYGIGGLMIPAPIGGDYYPEATLLANSIDAKLAQSFIDYMKEDGIKVYLTDSETFPEYRNKHYVIILGGPDAYEGVGEIVSQILTEEEKKKIREGRVWIKKSNVYREGQVVYILAGKDRNATAEVWKEYKEDIRKTILFNLG